MFSRVLNVVLLPLRMLCSHEFINRLGLRSLRDQRCDQVMEQCRGRLLDIGCGNNQLVRKYGHNSVGVDIYDFGAGGTIIEDSSKLPFENGAFETVSFVASFNHIPNRRETLVEVRRVLSDDGRVILTMISPFVGTARHKLAWWDRDQSERGIENGENLGLTPKYIITLFENEGFRLIKRKRFACWLNTLYAFEKIREPTSQAR